MLIKFSKMQGLGNDFMVIDGARQNFKPEPSLIKSLSHRHFGVGFDQLLLVTQTVDDDADFIYRIFNADGREVEQCGNGARCVAQFIAREGLSSQKKLKLKTMKGIIVATLLSDSQVEIDMGQPIFEPANVPFVAEQFSLSYTLTLLETSIEVSVLSVGNPHCVLFWDDVSSAPVTTVGKEISQHPRFLEGVNVEFVQVIAPDQVKCRVFERGVGETLACGSGACAAVVAGILENKLAKRVRVELPGGSLQVSWVGNGHSVFLTGPAVHIYDGQIEI